MRGVARLANIFLAKFLELLWWRTDCRLSDVGCTFRALWLSSYVRIRDQLRARGPEFSVEMITELLRASERIIEVPISYFGRSNLMYEKYRNFSTFRRMLRAIVRSKLRY